MSDIELSGPLAKTIGQLISENEQLRVRLEDAEQTIHAIQAGEVDAIVVDQADLRHQLDQDPAVRLIQETNGGVTYAVAVRKEISGMKVGYAGHMLLNDVKIAGQ